MQLEVLSRVKEKGSSVENPNLVNEKAFSCCFKILIVVHFTIQFIHYLHFGDFSGSVMD